MYNDVPGSLSNFFCPGYLHIWEAVADSQEVANFENKQRMKRANMGYLIFLFPNLGEKKSLITYHNLFFSIRNKGKIKIQNKPPFTELLFGVTCFRNIVKKRENTRGSINGSNRRTTWCICSESDLSPLRHRKNNNSKKFQEEYLRTNL